MDSLARFAGPAAITGSATLFTVDPANTWSVNSIILSNPGVTDVIVSLGINGLSSDKLFLPPTTVLAGGQGVFDDLIVLGAGDSMHAQTSSALTITVSGLKQT